MLRSGGIGVIPTDTIYGIVGSALSEKTVRRIYRARKRNPKKPMIILVGSEAELKEFGIRTTPRLKKILAEYWPGRVSIILPIVEKKKSADLKYLHRGTGTLAFRLPKPVWLRRFLLETGPLVAPSANPEGLRPAATVREAKKYFGDRVDFYLDRGKKKGSPSKLIRIRPDGDLEILR